MVLERISTIIIRNQVLHLASKYTKIKGNINESGAIRNY